MPNSATCRTGQGPCYRCLYPEPPAPGLAPNCAEGGVLGILPGLVGVIQAAEVIKLILGKGEPLIGRLLLIDALKMRFSELKLRRNPECPVCGQHRTVTRLIDYQQFCGFSPETPEEKNLKNGIPQLTVKELKRRIDAGEDAYILDVREPYEYQIANLRGQLIPQNEVPNRLVPPMDFIPLAEESGLILPIGDWGIAEACKQIQKWCREDPRHNSMRVCVNLSARQFSRQGLADHVEALLLEFGISSRQLGLEMTESSLIPSTSTAMEVLGTLRRLGVSLLMDDFGTGYSSLNYLHAFPFDVLKIDRTFVSRMTQGDQPLQIVRTIIELARVLGMEVVAEGIETCEQYRLLRQLGCRFGQGFLFARPLSAEAITELLHLPGRVLPEPEACKIVPH